MAFKMTIIVHLLSECRCKCEFCYAKEIQGYMNLELFDKVCKLFAPPHTRIILSGGEPLLRSDLTEIIQIAKKNGLAVNISTSASVVNDAIFEADAIQISLDYCSEKQDGVRGVKGLYQACLKLALECIERKIQWWFRSNILVDNFGDIIYLGTFFPLWINQLKFRGMQSYPNQQRILNRLYTLFLNKENVIIADPPFYYLSGMHYMVKDGSTCNAGIRYFSILPDGTINPCQFISYEFGKVQDFANYEELLNKAQKWRLSHPLGDEVCQKCEIFEYCGGGCFANSISLHQQQIFSPNCIFRSKQDQLLKELQTKVELKGNLRHQMAKKWMGC